MHWKSTHYIWIFVDIVKNPFFLWSHIEHKTLFSTVSKSTIWNLEDKTNQRNQATAFHFIRQNCLVCVWVCVIKHETWHLHFVKGELVSLFSCSLCCILFNDAFGCQTISCKWLVSIPGGRIDDNVNDIHLFSSLFFDTTVLFGCMNKLYGGFVRKFSTWKNGVDC